VIGKDVVMVRGKGVATAFLTKAQNLVQVHETVGNYESNLK
jgi:hypothetical protein